MSVKGGGGVPPKSVTFFLAKILSVKGEGYPPYGQNPQSSIWSFPLGPGFPWPLGSIWCVKVYIHSSFKIWEPNTFICWYVLNCIGHLKSFVHPIPLHKLQMLSVLSSKQGIFWLRGCCQENENWRLFVIMYQNPNVGYLGTWVLGQCLSRFPLMDILCWVSFTVLPSILCPPCCVFMVSGQSPGVFCCTILWTLLAGCLL